MTSAYRLGALGWLVTDVLEGNFGFMDQQAALSWVTTNIPSFGGDATRRTLVGQSAGAGSAAAHLVSPSSDPLFDHAVLMSSTIGLAISNPKYGAQLGSIVLKALDCPEGKDQMACLRSVSVADMLEAEYSSQSHIFLTHPLSVFLPWNVNAAGPVPENQLTAMLDNKLNRKPVIFGNVRNEGVIFIYQPIPHPLSAQEYEEIVLGVFLDDAPGVLKRYPGNHTDSRPIMSALATQYVLVCPQRAAARAISSSQPVYQYIFDHVSSFSSVEWGKNYTFCWDKTCHGSDLPFMFNVVRGPPPLPVFDAQEFALSADMMDFWGNFMATGNPNSGPFKPSTTWPAYSPQTDHEIIFRTAAEGGVTSIPDMFSDNCDFFDKIGYMHGEGKLHPLLQAIADHRTHHPES